MSVPLTVGGVTFQYPQQFDRNWGPTLTGWSTAVTNVLAGVSAGTFSVLTSTAANVAQSGLIRLANASTGIGFRNAANLADVVLTVNASNQLTFNGVPIGATASLTDGHIFVGNIRNNPTDVAMTGDVTISNTGVTAIGAGKIFDANINAAAGIDVNKFALLPAYNWYVTNGAGQLGTGVAVGVNSAVVTAGNGQPIASATTATEIGYVHGLTSAIQAQIDGKLTLTGGTMSGSLNMASNKIVSLAPGTATGNAIAWGQNFSGGIIGVTNGSVAAPGIVGEVIEAKVTSATPFPTMPFPGTSGQ